MRESFISSIDAAAYDRLHCGRPLIGMWAWQPTSMQRLKAASTARFAAFFVPKARQFNGGPGGEGRKPLLLKQSPLRRAVCQPHFGPPPLLAGSASAYRPTDAQEAIMAFDSLPGAQPAKLPHPQVLRIRKNDERFIEHPWADFGTILWYEDVAGEALVTAGLIDAHCLPGGRDGAIRISPHSVIYRNPNGNVMAVLDARKTAWRTPGFGAFMLAALAAQEKGASHA